MQYRREIDGLRALAVVPVVLFHAGYQPFRGGFVGVDVFFVISGYLITSLIVSEMEKGSFSLVQFYERRARRILPALVVVCSCCVPFAWQLMDAEEYLDFSRSLVSVASFSANFYYWDQGGYFTAPGERPLLHTWSLAVEEQFYLVYPLFLILTWRLGRRWLVALVAAFAIGSLSLAQFGASRFPDATFYLLPTRVWELDIGALCALVSVPRWIRQNPWLTLAGVALIAAGVFGFDDATPFPSVYTLVPVLGTTLVILAGGGANLPSRLLSSAPLVAVGLISYSAYLWHQPLFAFARIGGFAFDGTWEMGLLAVLSLVMAGAAWKLVEQPFRRPGALRPITRPVLFAFTGSCLIALAGIGIQGIATQGVHAGNQGMDAALGEILGRPEKPSGCKNATEKFHRHFRECTVTYAPHKRRVAVIGDSHAGAIHLALQRVGAERGIDLTLIMLGGCPPLQGAYVHSGNFGAELCRDVAAHALKRAVEQQWDAVILVARWSLYDGSKPVYRVSSEAAGASTDLNAYRSELSTLLKSTVAAFREHGIDVHIVKQVPEQPVSAKTVYRKLIFRQPGPDYTMEAIRRSSTTRAQHVALQAPIDAILAESGVPADHLIDLTDTFCGPEFCLLGEPGKSYYGDQDHLSYYGSQMAYEALKYAVR